MDNNNDVIERLNAERARLEALLDGVGLEDPSLGTEKESIGELSSLDQHPADMGTETFERTRDMSIRQAIAVQLQDIEHAVLRVADGSYGTCESCGREIGKERLDALPAARLCVEDQAKVERASEV